jgi:hypothetical protein
VNVAAKDSVPFVPWTDLVGASNSANAALSFCNDGNVCGTKPVCIRIIWKGTPCVMKEMLASATQFGRACLAMNDVKQLVGLESCDPFLVRSDRRVLRLEIQNKSFVGNYEVQVVSRGVLYIVMRYWEDSSLKPSQVG